EGSTPSTEVSSPSTETRAASTTSTSATPSRSRTSRSARLDTVSGRTAKYSRERGSPSGSTSTFPERPSESATLGAVRPPEGSDEGDGRPEPLCRSTGGRSVMLGSGSAQAGAPKAVKATANATVVPAHVLDRKSVV